MIECQRICRKRGGSCGIIVHPSKLVSRAGRVRNTEFCATARQPTNPGWQRRPCCAVMHMLSPPGRHDRHSGFCAVAPLREGDCESEGAGTWLVPQRKHLGDTCLARCQACTRCRYVSYTSTHSADLRYAGVPLGSGLCAWYATCDLNDLRVRWEAKLAGANWSTAHVRTSPLPIVRREPRNSSKRRLAIAALMFGTSQPCSLIAWCQGES